MILDKDYFTDREGKITEDPSKKLRLFGRKGQTVPDAIAERVGIKTKPSSNKATAPSENKAPAEAVEPLELKIEIKADEPAKPKAKKKSTKKKKAE